ncbi:MAG: sulfatase-like hydrolase/transferase [Candidatus Aminicenantes bacterium]|nr:sulfatase-like hydrolase/transferase [Candidatus Aminicenantes bacterium]
MKEGEFNSRREFLFSFLAGLVLSTGFWVVEVALFLISKLRQPGIWFYLPLKIWLLYLSTGITLAALSWIASLLVLKRGKRTLDKFRSVFGSIFISSFLTIYLLALYQRVFHHFLEGIFYFLNMLIILLISVLVGWLLSRSPRRIAKLLKISLISVAASASFLILFLTVFDINAKFFPKVTAGYQRHAQSKPNVVLIIIDALRADHLSCLGYSKIETPNIDRIAREGVLFADCIAQAPWTLPSMGSILTSRYPSQHGAEMQQIRKGLNPDDVIVLREGFLYEENTTLAELLKEDAYYTLALQPNITAGTSVGFNQGFDFHFDCHKYKNLLLERIAGWISNRKISRVFYPSFKYAKDEKVVNYMKNWVEINHHKQFFMSILLFDCHEYHLKERVKKEKYYIPSVELYDNEIKKTDEHIGEIYDFLKKMGILDQTILVLLSDHGEEFGDHGGYDRGYEYEYDSGKMHAHTLYDEILRIPLIIRYPKKIKGNKIVNQQVRSIDILPTILSLLDISYEGTFEGLDLSRNNFTPEDNLKAYSESILEGAEKKSLRTKEWKLIYHPVSQRYELYNLAQDPEEKVNLVRQEERVFASLKNELFSWMERMPKEETKAKKKRKLSEEEIEALKALGYIK